MFDTGIFDQADQENLRGVERLLPKPPVGIDDMGGHMRAHRAVEVEPRDRTDRVHRIGQVQRTVFDEGAKAGEIRR